MPVTTVDVPQNLLDLIDSVVKSGTARNRREVIVNALEVYSKLQAHRWRGHFIFINGIRKALVSKGSLTELMSGMTDAELFDAGKRMGMTLRNSAMQRRLDISLPRNHPMALRMLEDFGWGDFAIDDRQITISDSIFPPSLIHGYLETALSIKLRKTASFEDILVFDQELQPATARARS